MKTFKIIAINILILIMLFIFAEMTACLYCIINYKDYIKKYKSDNPIERIINLSEKPQEWDYKEMTQKTKVYQSQYSSLKRPIVTIGCSYTEGLELDDSQTFAYKLNKLTGRTTYNRGFSGTGPQHVYRQLSDKNFKNEVPDAEYFIYTFIKSHSIRLIRYIDQPLGEYLELSYSLKNGKLVKNTHPLSFLYHSFLYRVLLNNITGKRYEYEESHGSPLLMKVLEESVKQMHQKYPNSKFVLLDFPEFYDYGNEPLYLSKDIINKIQNMGIIYINVKELVGHDFADREKYCVADKYHPNELVWDEITPKLVKKLNL